MNNSDQPFYIIPSDHPLIEEWKPWFENFEKGHDDFVFLARPSDIDNGHTGKVKGMAMALQHYPHLIEKMVFAVRFDFNLMDDVDIPRSDDWKKDSKIRRWLFNLADMPQLLFLVKDSQARFFMIADDILSNVKGPSFLSDENAKYTIVGRFFTSCLYFLIYCYNTGFQPDLYIDALIAEHEMPFTVNEVKDAYVYAIKDGCDWRNPYKNG
jgi:hypothetical protein